MNTTESKDTSATGRHGADLALMRLGHEMRRRIRDRLPLVDALRETGERMQSDAVLLWMPCCGLRLPVAVRGGEVSVAVATEFDGIAARVNALEHRNGPPALVQGDDAGGARRAACRLLVTPVPHFGRSEGMLARLGAGVIDQSAGVTVKSSKYTWLSALDHRPTRPETGWGRTCSR